MFPCKQDPGPRNPTTRGTFEHPRPIPTLARVDRDACPTDVVKMLGFKSGSPLTPHGKAAAWTRSVPLTDAV
jgi:hypothetical protein